MSFDKVFYLLDHRLIALAMVVLLVTAGEIGFRRGLFRRGLEGVCPIADERYRRRHAGTVGSAAWVHPGDGGFPLGRAA